MMIRRTPSATRPYTPYSYPTRVRSQQDRLAVGRRLRHPNIARNHGLIHAVAEIAADVGSDHFAEIVAPVEHGEHHALKRQVLVQAAAHPVDGPHEMAETLKGIEQIGRAHVCTPVTNAHLVCPLLLEK